MSPAAQHESADRSFCLELVHRIRPKRPICERFLADGMQEERLALAAFLCTLEETTESGRDAHVAQAKLAWWSGELLIAPPGESQHPIVRLMDRTGVLGLVDRRMIQEAIRVAQDRIDRDVVPDLEALGRLCERIGAVELHFEAAVAGYGDPLVPILQQGARLNGLAGLLRQSLRASTAGCWWLPLELSARTGATRDRALVDWKRVGPESPFRDLRKAARSWAPDWADLDALRRAFTDSADVAGSPPAVWAIESALHAHHLFRLGRTSRTGADSLLGARPADVLLAWRATRLLRSVCRFGSS